MAIYNNDDEKLLDPNNPGAQSQQGAGTQNALATSAPGGAIVSGGGPVSTAGVGRGGMGGWTNIQAYLNANQGDNRTAGYLNQKIGGQFDQEKQRFDQSANEVKQKAQDSQSKLVGTDQASQLINQYAGQKGSDGYNQAKQKVQGALSAQWDPALSGFAYETQAPTTNYGESLKSDQSFNGLMGNIYNEAAGGRIGKGALALQKQLDTGNEEVANTRQALLQKYMDLQNDLESGTQATDQELKDKAQAFQQGQNALRGYLNTTQGEADKAIQNKVSSANSFVNNLFNSIGGNLGRGFKQYGTKEVLSEKRPQITGDNLGGVTDEKNRFNMIADLLGGGFQYKDMSPVSLSDFGYTGKDIARWNMVPDPSGTFEGGVNAPVWENRYHALSDFLTDAERQQAVALGMVPGAVAAPRPDPIFGMDGYNPDELPIRYDEYGRPRTVVRG